MFLVTLPSPTKWFLNSFVDLLPYLYLKVSLIQSSGSFSVVNDTSAWWTLWWSSSYQSPFNCAHDIVLSINLGDSPFASWFLFSRTTSDKGTPLNPMIVEKWLMKFDSRSFRLSSDSNGTLDTSLSFVLNWPINFSLIYALYIAVSNFCISMASLK